MKLCFYSSQACKQLKQFGKQRTNLLEFFAIKDIKSPLLHYGTVNFKNLLLQNTFLWPFSSLISAQS